MLRPGQSFTKKIRRSNSSLHGDLRPTWQTSRQKDNEKRAQRWDRKDWSYRKVSLRFVQLATVLFSETRLLLVLTVHVTRTLTQSHTTVLVCRVLQSKLQFRDIVIRCVARLHVISSAQNVNGTVSYQLWVKIRKIYVEIFVLCLVQCQWPLKVVATREESWEVMADGWYLTPRLAMSVASQVPILRFQCHMEIFCEGCRFQMAIWSRKASPWHRTWRERNANYFLHFWRRSTSTGRISSRHRFAQPRNQSTWLRKKLDLHARLHSALRTKWQTYRQAEKQQETRPALGTKELVV